MIPKQKIGLRGVCTFMSMMVAVIIAIILFVVFFKFLFKVIFKLFLYLLIALPLYFYVVKPLWVKYGYLLTN